MSIPVTSKPASLLTALVAIATLFVLPPARAETTDESATVHQLRIYELYKDNTGTFHERFQKHAMRIMDRYDFNIISTWESHHADKVEFVYLLEWPSEETMKRQWEKFMEDGDWSDIKKITGKQHGRFVNGIEDRTLKLTDYSPNGILTLQ